MRDTPAGLEQPRPSSAPATRHRVLAFGSELLTASPGETSRRELLVDGALAAGLAVFGTMGTVFASHREREVVGLVAEGLSNEEIAARLVVSPATAKTHVSRAMGKLRARDRARLVVIAYESGLVRPGWLG